MADPAQFIGKLVEDQTNHNGGYANINDPFSHILHSKNYSPNSNKINFLTFDWEIRNNCLPGPDPLVSDSDQEQICVEDGHLIP
ncbi:hypothetical protein JYT44_02475 [Caldithrix abyssi]|nr:hypothetical protein [Caldithrix abyssi]